MKIAYTEQASEQLGKLPRAVQERIKAKLQFYTEQPDPLRFAKHLVGLELYRFRIGDYRVIFEVAGSRMFIISIVKRDKAYRDL